MTRGNFLLLVNIFLGYVACAIILPIEQLILSSLIFLSILIAIFLFFKKFLFENERIKIGLFIICVFCIWRTESTDFIISMDRTHTIYWGLVVIIFYPVFILNKEINSERHILKSVINCILMAYFFSNIILSFRKFNLNPMKFMFLLLIPEVIEYLHKEIIGKKGRNLESIILCFLFLALAGMYHLTPKSNNENYLSLFLRPLFWIGLTILNFKISLIFWNLCVPCLFNFNILMEYMIITILFDRNIYNCVYLILAILGYLLPLWFEFQKTEYLLYFYSGVLAVLPIFALTEKKIRSGEMDEKQDIRD